jgi:aldehyde dehydrogenase (NAD+)
MSRDCIQFYVNGQWVDPLVSRTMDIVNPATESVIGRVSLGTARDVDCAIEAAAHAFETFSSTSREERIALLQKVAHSHVHLGQKMLTSQNIHANVTD